MSLKFTNGKAGVITYKGRKVTVWLYDTVHAYISEVKRLGRYLDKDSIAWIERDFLIYEDNVVGETTKEGSITWVTPRRYQGFDKVPTYQEEAQAPQTSRGKRREAPAVDVSMNIDIDALWAGILGFDWESIMIKTTTA